MTEVVPESGGYELDSTIKYLNFKKVDVTEVDGSKPWKPATKVKVTKADGKEEEIPAGTPFFTFTDKDGKRLTVTAATAGHIDDLHIKGTEPGSRFAQSSLEELFVDVAGKLPDGLTAGTNTSVFDIDMGKNMGKEGLASTQELLADGVITQGDIDKSEEAREEVATLNTTGTPDAKQAFVARFKGENPACKIQFQVIRKGVIVPVVQSEKRPTEKLFMVFGYDQAQGCKTLWTAAPGRNMPRHPNPTEFRPEEGGVEGLAFQESKKAWFDTVMLV